jgi:hypothetical protein
MEITELIESTNFTIEDLGVQEEWVYDIEVQDNHNFFANDILVHNSKYVSIDKVLIKKFGPDYSSTLSKERFIDFVKNYIDKIAMPIVRDTLDNKYAYAMNAYLPEKLQEDAEIISDTLISIVPKTYYARIFWSEGVTLAEPKLKITGLSTVRSSTPKFYRPELKKAMAVLIDNDMIKTKEYIKKVKEESKNKSPLELCINQSVSSLDYQYDVNTKKFRRYDKAKDKYLGAPINSRAALIHNKYIEDNNIPVKPINEGDKISFIHLKEPNIVGSNVIAFRDESVFDYGLKEYIDYETIFEKGFMSGIEQITVPLKWDLSDNIAINEDEW